MGDACASVDELLSGYLDEELTQGDRQRVDIHLEKCARCTARLRELDTLRASVGRLRQNADEHDREQWRKVMDKAVDRTVRGIGWLLLGGAALVLVGYAGYEFVLAETEAPLVKWAGGALYVGLAVLLLSVLRQRLAARKKDPYKDVEI